MERTIEENQVGSISYCVLSLNEKHVATLLQALDTRAVELRTHIAVAKSLRDKYEYECDVDNLCYMDAAKDTKNLIRSLKDVEQLQQILLNEVNTILGEHDKMEEVRHGE